MSQQPSDDVRASTHAGESASGAENAAPMTAYTMYAVFRSVRGPGGLPDDVRDGAAAEFEELLGQLAGKSVVTRGVYSVSGFRHDADYLIWWVAPRSEDLQDAYVRFLRTQLGRASDPVWSVIGLHRDAEFNKAHIPAFLAGMAPKSYVCVYPYNRTNEWYLLDPADRGAMLREHGIMGREYPDVLANTVAAFALGDYEFLLAFEADELHRIVDLMRHLRGAQARAHTRLETPFFTGPRMAVPDLVAALP
jgi:hydrogen peroxide-dependent heme synthase